MNPSPKICAVIATLSLSMCLTALAQSTITQWTFEGDTLNAAVGSGTAQNIGGTSSAFAAGNGGGRGWNTSAYPDQLIGSGTAGVSFSVNTTGFESISLSFDQRASGTASRWAQVDYSTDGGTTWELDFWNNNGGLSPHDTFYSFNVDFSSISAINQNPNFVFRIVSIFAPNAFDQNATITNLQPSTAYQRANTQSGPVGTGVGTGNYTTAGTWRFDNVTIRGFGAGNIIVDVQSGTQTDATGFTGSAGLNKIGAGTAILTGNSDFTGPLNILEGSVSLNSIGNAGSPGPAGAGSQIALGDSTTAGSLVYTGTGEQTDRSVTVSAGGGIIEIQGAANLAIAGIQGSGNFTKTGTGNLTTDILAIGNGLLAVPEGQLVLNFTPASTNSANVASGLADFAGDIVISTSSRLNIVSTGTIQGGGKLILEESDSAFSANGATPMVLTMNNEIVLNPDDLPDFMAHLGATAGNQHIINNTISGNGGVRFSAGTSGGAGLILLNQQLTYSGNTEINNSFTGVVRLGVDNAIPVTSGITFGILDDTGSRGTLDLNGFDQTLTFIANGLSQARGIVNSGATLSTLTLNQEIDTSFNGVIGVPTNTTNIPDANDNIALVKNGSGTLTLLQTNNYSGGTVVNNGRLVAAANDAFGSGQVLVQGGAVEISTGVSIVNGVVLDGGSITGAGTVGTISGNGLVSPGFSPGILTAGFVDPTLGTDFAFEFIFSEPDFLTPDNSLNDLLRLTDINPLGTGLAASNVVSIYYNVGLLDVGDSFKGGFYLDQETSFNNLVNGAQFIHYVFGDGGGTHAFENLFYYTLAEYNSLSMTDFSILVSTLALNADFGSGSINGGITEFVVIPEGRISWLFIFGILALFIYRKLNRQTLLIK